MSIIGIDIGFGFTKATDGNRSLIFKSIYGEAVDFQFREKLLKGSRNDEYLHIDVDDSGYFVGDLAEQQSSNRFFTLDQSQFVGSSTRILALAALSNIVQQPEEPVKLVVGLPISHYRQFKSELSGMFKDRHALILTGREGTRIEMNIKVAEVKVLPQPTGSILDRLLDKHGKITDKRFAQEKIGVIDIGFRTTDYTISDKTRYSERGSLTVQTGISRSFAIIAAKLKEISGVDVELYRLFDAVDKGSIKIRGKGFDLRKIVQHAMEQLASTIAADANRVWADDWDIDAIMITGGGGSVLAPYLQEQIEGLILPLDDGLDHRMNNVRGYCKLGHHLWSDISPTG
ncbi:MAG: ParM/StbA family protein [Mariprofundaceae bacterium]